LISDGYYMMMQKIVTLSLLVGFFTAASAQQENSYMMEMVQQKKSLNMARSVSDFQILAERFATIAVTESSQWHPLYYAALCYINMSILNEQPEHSEGFLNQAQKLIDKAFVIYPDESELFVLQALLYQARIRADTAGRRTEYMNKAGVALDRAKSCNTDNPRIYYLMGLNLLILPESAGGGPAAACPMFNTATEKFRNEKPSHVLTPDWGGERNEQYQSQYCKKQ
jgi:tetratricopeptide (TPR) repeat protein